VANFTHLHLHTEYSLLDGAIRIPELAETIHNLGMTSVAITDHGWMGGAVEFYKACRAAEVKPIIGVEAYLTWDSDGSEEKNRDNFHAVLLAQDAEGYHELLRLMSEGHSKNFYYKGRIAIPKLARLKGHVIATSACLGGILPKIATWDEETLTISDPDRKVRNMVKMMKSLLGDDNFYIEMQSWDDPEGRQQAWNDFALELADDTKTPLVVTTDAHYLREVDHVMHEFMMAMQFKKTLKAHQDSGKMQYSPDFWIKPPEDMRKIARELGDISAYHNTMEIADRCNTEIELGTYYPPVFDPSRAPDYDEFLNWKGD
jgi:DNA polymerase III subunit alpha